MPQRITQELEHFLRSFKNSESISADLSRAISVETVVKKAVREALSDNNTVLVCGSAGSGKTHILDEIAREADIPVIGAKDENPGCRHLFVVRDATELTAEERVACVTDPPSSRVAMAMAINEGPMREAAAAPRGEVFGNAIKLLHDARQGISRPYVPQLPTVIDAAAYEPLEDEVIGRVLATPIVQDLIDELIERSGPESPRGIALRQLKAAEVRARVTTIAKLALYASGDWLFRDVWDLVGDLLLGGSDEGENPTTPCFLLQFFGDAELSGTLRQVIHPAGIALPFIDPRIFHGHWGAHQLQLVEDVDPLVLSQPDVRPERFLLQKVQVLVIGKEVNVSARLVETVTEDLWHAVVNHDKTTVIHAINRYITFGLSARSGSRLDLWVEHRVERRTSHNLGLVRVGEAGHRELEIVRSNVANNHPIVSYSGLGSDYFLLHKPSSATLGLHPERIRRIESGRAVRVSDRTRGDLDWDLHHFFGQILRSCTNGETIEVFQIDLEEGRANRSSYVVDTEAGTIEIE